MERRGISPQLPPRARRDGAFIGVCDVDVLEPGWNYVFDMYMTFVGDTQLAFVAADGVFAYMEQRGGGARRDFHGEAAAYSRFSKKKSA